MRYIISKRIEIEVADTCRPEVIQFLYEKIHKQIEDYLSTLLFDERDFSMPFDDENNYIVVVIEEDE